jgi:glycosyltransferase involved in cell wall biosynthesis
VKKVLFIGTTYYNLSDNSHLKKKFEGLSKGMKIFVLARGRLSHQKKWESDFYLLPKNFLFYTITLLLGFYLCLFKKIDVIVCQSPLAQGFIGTILKKILRKELIIEVHGDWIEATFLSKQRKLEFLERKIVPYLARFSLKNADKIRAVSKFTKIQAMKISGDKPYFVFPAFTDLDIFLHEKDIKFNNYILFVGHLEKVKGIEYLIGAFNKIHQEFPDFRLVLIGEGGERKNYELRITNYQLQDKVKFTGELPLEEVQDIMKNCYCLVLPSLSEGLGRVIMEAMALGKPVIGSNVGGIPDLITDDYNGFLVEPKNRDDLYEKMKVLLRDKDLAMQMGKKGREIIKQNFSNQKYIENYIKMINQ